MNIPTADDMRKRNKELEKRRDDEFLEKSQRAVEEAFKHVTDGTRIVVVNLTRLHDDVYRELIKEKGFALRAGNGNIEITWPRESEDGK